MAAAKWCVGGAGQASAGVVANDSQPNHVFEAVCGYATLPLEKRNFFISGFMGLSDGRLQARERGTARLNQVETKCSHCKGIYKIWCRKKINLNLR